MANHSGIRNEDLHAELHQIRRIIIKKKNSGMQVATTIDLSTLLQQYSEKFQIGLSL